MARCTHNRRLEVRTLPNGLPLEMRRGPPGLVIVQGSDRVRVGPAHVKTVHSASLRDGMVAAVGDAAADLAVGSTWPCVP